mmetsp:Transcript_43189/g.71817  ORF Transcript_43189/g.71817 Transcript_43189/m.71817 type:complete len:85 (-) Transcript_43189:116-370(-)
MMRGARKTQAAASWKTVAASLPAWLIQTAPNIQAAAGNSVAGTAQHDVHMPQAIRRLHAWPSSCLYNYACHDELAAFAVWDGSM